MVDVMSATGYPDRFLPPTPSSGSRPIPVPKRRSCPPPPSSPIRDQNSPELVFNFDFSVSPDVPDMTASVFLQNQGATNRLFPLQKRAASYLPLSVLGSELNGAAHPYAHEPFLYAVPKAPFRDSQNTHRDTNAVRVGDDVSKASSADDEVGPSLLHGSLLGRPASSVVSSQPSATSCHPSPDRSMDPHSDEDDEHPLTTAFRGQLVSPSVFSCGTWSDRDSSSPSSFYRSPPSSPPRVVTTSRRMSPRARLLLPSRSNVLQRTAAAEPVISLNVAQAERPYFSSRGRSPYPGIVKPRPRRSSSVGTGHSLEKIRERARRMSTVVGRGAGRVVSLAENRRGSGMSLVSDEDIERSLEKDSSGGGSHGKTALRRQYEEGMEEDQLEGEAERERGRARARVPLRGTTARVPVLPGWQWTEAR
ncbi:hypothetical protein C8Q78DRAFT_834566 [Trametes maxima]|nr:hypothetical protein C8Q78DRAFT_834566 [Trametes maxima]